MRGERPITTPAGRAHAVDTITAVITRANVSAADETSSPHSAHPSCASRLHRRQAPRAAAAATAAIASPAPILDLKSTRLNSSHGYISYAVFCLKKKKDTHT